MKKFLITVLTLLLFVCAGLSGCIEDTLSESELVNMIDTAFTNLSAEENFKLSYFERNKLDDDDYGEDYVETYKTDFSMCGTDSNTIIKLVMTESSSHFSYSKNSLIEEREEEESYLGKANDDTFYILLSWNEKWFKDGVENLFEREESKDATVLSLEYYYSALSMYKKNVFDYGVFRKEPILAHLGMTSTQISYTKKKQEYTISVKAFANIVSGFETVYDYKFVLKGGKCISATMNESKRKEQEVLLVSEYKVDFTYAIAPFSMPNVANYF